MSPHTKGMIMGISVATVFIVAAGLFSHWFSTVTGIDYNYLFVGTLSIIFIVFLFISHKHL